MCSKLQRRIDLQKANNIDNRHLNLAIGHIPVILSKIMQCLFLFVSQRFS